MERLQALAEYLSEEHKEKIDISEISFENNQPNYFEYSNEEYLVLEDEQADQMAKDYILETVWAFNSSFLSAHTDGIDEEIFDLLKDKCETANEPILRMIKDKDHFVDDAISSDGRAHFISTYDGQENQYGEYYIYRTN